MDVRLAPLEGVTDAVCRRVHHQLFGGVSRYYIPFITPSIPRVFTTRDLRAIDPKQNEGVPVIPQLLTRDPELFLWAANELQALGYDEVNLNAGCPSGTVTAKGRGAGLLRDPAALQAFLDAIFQASPLPISIKTRIGFEDPAEWPALLNLLKQYPLKELIIHPRTRSGFYKGELYPACAESALDAGLPVVYNGDLFTPEDIAALQARWPGMPVMLGRGLISNPALARQTAGGNRITAEEIRGYHDALQRGYAAEFPPDQVHSRLREHMKYLSCCFEGAGKALKALRKSNPNNYPEAAAMLFALPLREDVGYQPRIFNE